MISLNLGFLFIIRYLCAKQNISLVLKKNIRLWKPLLESVGICFSFFLGVLLQAHLSFLIRIFCPGPAVGQSKPYFGHFTTRCGITHNSHPLKVGDYAVRLILVSI